MPGPLSQNGYGRLMMMMMMIVLEISTGCLLLKLVLTMLTVMSLLRDDDYDCFVRGAIELTCANPGQRARLAMTTQTYW